MNRVQMVGALVHPYVAQQNPLTRVDGLCSTKGCQAILNPAHSRGSDRAPHLASYSSYRSEAPV